MAIYSDSDYASIIQIKNDFFAYSNTVRDRGLLTYGYGGGWGRLWEGPTLRFYLERYSS